MVHILIWDKRKSQINEYSDNVIILIQSKACDAKLKTFWRDHLRLLIRRLKPQWCGDQQTNSESFTDSAKLGFTVTTYNFSEGRIYIGAIVHCQPRQSGMPWYITLNSLRNSCSIGNMIQVQLQETQSWGICESWVSKKIEFGIRTQFGKVEMTNASCSL